jgi:hypothetical protein
MLAYVGIPLILAPLLLIYAMKRRQLRQLAFIESYQFHPALERRVLAKYPHLSAQQLVMVFDGLRDYFHLCQRARRRMVAMPSQVVDMAWHEFILFTKAYSHFSRAAIGRYLHHTPTEAMRTPTLAQEGIKRAWRLACAKESINPSHPHRLPLIFAIDGLLNIEDGFKYSLDCQDKSSPNYGSGYCAGHIGCTSGCGGDSGGSFDGGSFDGGGDASSCGGGGCGGD